MRLQQLKINNFRLLESVELQPAEGTTLLAGANAQGKTSLLEAVSYLSTGRSFRARVDREVIAWSLSEKETQPNQRFAAVEGTFSRQGSQRHIRIAIQPQAKSVWIDGKPLKALTGLWGLLPTVCFVPADLGLVQGPPLGRRNLLDRLMGQLDSSFLTSLSSYTQALQSRNSLLRHPHPPIAQLSAFEATMAEHGARLLTRRAWLVAALAEATAPLMVALSDGAENLTLAYEAGLPISMVESIGVGHLHADPEKEAALREQLVGMWHTGRKRDQERRQTLDGPHRDDVRFDLGGQDIRRFGSQGQTRSLVLALRLAEVALVEKVTGAAPLLLLDDILGELDAARGERFLHLVAERELQTLITATNATPVEQHLPVQRRFIVDGGRVTPA
jgi:DNA replication and repair protein RecF